MTLLSEKQAFRFRIKAGESQSEWVSVQRDQVTRLMIADIEANGNSVDISFNTRRTPETGEGRRIKQGLSTVNDFEISVTADGNAKSPLTTGNVDDPNYAPPAYPNVDIQTFFNKFLYI